MSRPSDVSAVVGVVAAVVWLDVPRLLVPALCLTMVALEIWYAANAFMGWVLMAGAIAGAATLALLPATTKRWQLLASVLLPMLCAVMASFMYLDGLA